MISGDQVEIGEGSSIGFLTIVRGKDIRLGPYVQIGAMTFLDTPTIHIGEGTKINEQVFVGGLQFPDSRFIVGRNCQIMQLTYINPAPSVVIGDDAGIGGHCLIFGHSSFQNCFDGYAVKFAPIEIGNGAGLAWRVFVLPGTKIGDGSLIGANSLVSGTIPANTMAVGFPAKVVGRPPAFPRKLSDYEKVEMFRKITSAMVDFLTGSGFECIREENDYQIRVPRRGFRFSKTWRMYVTDGDVRVAVRTLGPAKVDVLLSLNEVPPDVRELLTSRGVVWIDVARKERPHATNDLGDEVLNFLKRYGVRTLRYPPPEQSVSVISNLGVNSARTAQGELKG